MAYHGHPLTQTEGALREPMALSSQDSSDSRPTPSGESQATTVARHRIGLIVLLVALIVAGALIVAYLLR